MWPQSIRLLIGVDFDVDEARALKLGAEVLPCWPWAAEFLLPFNQVIADDLERIVEAEGVVVAQNCLCSVLCSSGSEGGGIPSQAASVIST